MTLGNVGNATGEEEREKGRGKDEKAWTKSGRDWRREEREEGVGI